MLNSDHVEKIEDRPELRSGESISQGSDDPELAAERLDQKDHLVGRDIEEIRDIEAAYKRIQGGTFGLCSDCDADIDYPRLTAYPTAKRCVRCQTQHEKTFAKDNRPSL